MEDFEEAGVETVNHFYAKGGHPSKQYVFRNECSVCGRPLRRNSKNKIGFLCRKCGPPSKNTRDERNSACVFCPFEMDCMMRVQLGMWLRCETPDIADLERLRLTGGFDNENLRTLVEIALGGRGNRQVLEKAVSEGTKKVYQSCITGRQREVPHMLREYG